MFPAIADAGGAIDADLNDEHRREQTLVYDAECALLDAKLRPTAANFSRVAAVLSELRDRLIPHLQLEEQSVLPQVPVHFDHDAQAALLRTIIDSIPHDSRVQPWIAAALTPEHREARLRNMAASLAPQALRAVMQQIRDGVDDSVWADITTRTPDLAALADDQP